MKVHCYNILLFSLLLNTLLLSSSQVNIEMNHYNTPHIKNAEPTESYRSLCECEIYTSIYDNDPEMKEIMHDFDRQTSKRFEEYNERMNKNRQKCKEQCDRDIQKIILKDKLEKQMAQQLTTLETKIDTDDIPTCICEKSMADKMEKFCLNCGVNVGGGVTLSSGVLGGIGEVPLSALRTSTLEAAMADASAKGLAAGEAAGLKEGMRVVIGALEQRGVRDFCPKLLESIGSKIPYTDSGEIGNIILENLTKKCGVDAPVGSDVVCTPIRTKLGMILAGNERAPPDNFYIQQMMKVIVGKAEQAADIKAAQVSSATSSKIIAKQTALIEGGFNSTITSINAAIIAIVVIVLIMVIIYLILHYRRKKKMKKKLQYIKLLEE
ncbi:rifin [Plasmodium reichenowi]|uniref:Rifin n=1 Tax=Plasmodium reichenowi TaxID=5854 RepID=A0A060RMN0_PLARE|nr:rifin [Plasmodium reichenowi]